jgi:hypothetical protein
MFVRANLETILRILASFLADATREVGHWGRTQCPCAIRVPLVFTRRIGTRDSNRPLAKPSTNDP